MVVMVPASILVKALGSSTKVVTIFKDWIRLKVNDPFIIEPFLRLDQLSSLTLMTKKTKKLIYHP
jgi:hypothetical protein